MMETIIGFVIGVLAGVALAWPYGRREGIRAGWQKGYDYAVRQQWLTAEEAARSTP